MMIMPFFHFYLYFSFSLPSVGFLCVPASCLPLLLHSVLNSRQSSPGSNKCFLPTAQAYFTRSSPFFFFFSPPLLLYPFLLWTQTYHLHLHLDASSSLLLPFPKQLRQLTLPRNKNPFWLTQFVPCPVGLKNAFTKQHPSLARGNSSLCLFKLGYFVCIFIYCVF